MNTPTREGPFVAQIRSRPGVVRLAGPDEAVLTLRVTIPESWDTLRLEVAPSVSVREVKLAALAAMLADTASADAFVCKLAGFEVLDESLSVAAAGLRDGSTLLVTYRLRRPVK